MSKSELRVKLDHLNKELDDVKDMESYLLKKIKRVELELKVMEMKETA